MDFKFLDGKSNDEIKKYIEEKKLDANIIVDNRYEKTILMFVCEKNNLELVKYLIKQGADITAKNFYGKTALFYARRNNDIIEYLIANIINLNDFNCFKSSIKELEECKIILKWIQKDEEKLQNQLNRWLEQQCNNLDYMNIKFLLDYGANKEIIYNQIKNSIEPNKFDTFKFFVKKFKECGIRLEQVINEDEWKIKLQNQSNDWLEEKCDKRDEENVKFLLDCVPNKKETLKFSISRENLKTFKYLIEEDAKLFYELRKLFYELINENEWNEKLQNQLNHWLEQECNELNYTNIKFLLDYGANKEIICNQIRNSIESPNFEKFKFLVKNFKECGVSLEQVINEDEWKIKLQNQLNYWLKQQCNNLKYLNVKFLLDYGANKEIMHNQIKSSIENSNFDNFKFLVENFKEYGITLNKIKEEGFEEKLQNQLDKWLEEKYNKEYYIKEEVDFLLEHKANRIKAVKLSIKEEHFYSFKNLIKEDRMLLNELRKEEYLGEKLQDQLDKWLYYKKQKYSSFNDDIKFLLDCGAKEISLQELNRKKKSPRVSVAHLQDRTPFAPSLTKEFDLTDKDMC